MSNLSRRGLIARGAALAAAGTVIPLPAAADAAAPAIDNDAVIALAERAIEAHKTMEKACEATTPFEEAYLEWRKKNPEPRLPYSQIKKWKGHEKYTEVADPAVETGR